MSLEKITVKYTDDGNNPQTLDLDGVRVTLVTYTNKADGAWYLDTFDDQGNRLDIGRAIVTGLDLWYSVRYKQGIPPGILFVLPQTGVLEDPGLDSFENEESVLVYQTAS